jgi:hypothetical protein
VPRRRHTGHAVRLLEERHRPQTGEGEIAAADPGVDVENRPRWRRVLRCTSAPLVYRCARRSQWVRRARVADAEASFGSAAPKPSRDSAGAYSPAPRPQWTPRDECAEYTAHAAERRVRRHGATTPRAGDERNASGARGFEDWSPKFASRERHILWTHGQLGRDMRSGGTPSVSRRSA